MQHDGGVGPRRVGHGLQQQLGGGAAHFVVLDADGGQRGLHAVHQRHVVVAGDRYVARHVQAGLAQRIHGAQGNQVIAGHQGRDGRRPAPGMQGGQQALAGGVARIDGIGVAGFHQLGVQPGFLHGQPEALKPPLAGRKALRAGQVGNVPVAQPGQMPDRLRHARKLIAHHGRAAALGIHAVDQNHGHPGLAQQGQQRVLAAGRCQNDPVNALGQHALDQVLCGQCGPCCIGNQRKEPAFLQAVFNAPQDGREHRVGDVGQEDSHALRFAGAQRGCCPVGPVTKPVGSLLHAAHHFGTDEVAAGRVQRPRDA